MPARAPPADSAQPPPPASLGRPALSVALLPLPHFTLLPFAGFLDTLRLAADEGDRSRPRACRWTILAPDAAPLRASCGAEIAPWETLRDAARDAPDGRPRFDYVVVVGGLLHGAGPLDPRTAEFLRGQQRRGVGLIGICTGSLALAEAGLLPAGARICVSWYHYNDVLERHPGLRPVADRLWLREGRVITCAGGTAAVDLAASLVQQHLGASAAQKSLHIMVADQARPANAVQPQPPATSAARNPRVRRAILLMEQNLAAPLPAEAIAAGVAISRRQLERLFREELGTSLQAFGRDLRLSYAVWLLANSAARITDVALQCGFADAAHFNRAFRAAFGRPPSEARAAGPAALQAMLAAWWPYGGLTRGGAAPDAGGAAAPAPALADRRPYL